MAKKNLDPAAIPGLLRFDLPCTALGFEPPPAPTQLRFLRHGDSWHVVVLVPAGMATPAAHWVERHLSTKPTMAPGIAPRVLRCELRPDQTSHLGWLTAARVLQIEMTPHGTATMFVQGSTEQLAVLAGHLGEPAAFRQRAFATMPFQDLEVTPRQLEVLANAVAMGYYDVPHRVDLRRLGKSMGLSVSAVSQLLRRAQGKVIRRFIDTQVLTQGERLSSPQTRLDSDPPKGE